MRGGKGKCMGYEVIANTGRFLVQLLCRELVPEVILYRNSIGLCSPEEHGDFKLGIYLYDISQSEDIVAAGMIDEGVKCQRYPPVYVSLSYMITAYSDSDLKYRSGEEQKILGRVAQTMHDNSVITEAQLGDGVSMSARIEMLRIEQYEKVRLWNFPNIPYKLSLFYKVGPVEISSEKTREVARVRDIRFQFKES